MDLDELAHRVDNNAFFVIISVILIGVAMLVVLTLQALHMRSGTARYQEVLTNYMTLCDRLVTGVPTRTSQLRGVTLEVDGRLVCVEGDQRGEMAESVKLPRRP